MALKQELMAVGMPAAQASRLGFDAVTAVTAAGSSQVTAATMPGNNVTVTVPTIGNGVILTSAEQIFNITNSGPNTLLIYPVVGGTFDGLALNAPITLAPGGAARIEGSGLAGATWIIS